MTRLTALMIESAQELNDFFAGVTHAEQWMADFIAHFNLSLPVDVEGSTRWAELIEISALTPFVPLDSTQFEYVEGMSHRTHKTSILIPLVYYQLLADIVEEAHV